jgi:hypothetical protein
MALTKAQRKKINKINASKSTGPRTQEGRDIARRNALTHGLTAEVLSLHNEDQNIIKIQINQWVDFYLPENPGEMVLVEQAAIASLKLRRAARCEKAIVTRQIETVDERQANADVARLARLSVEVNNEAERGIRQLKTFSLGINYLLDRWAEIDGALDKFGHWPDNLMMNDAIMYRGANQHNLAGTIADGFAIALYNSVLCPKCNPQYLRNLLTEDMNPSYRAEYGSVPPDKASAMKRLKAIIVREVSELKELLPRIAASEQRDRECEWEKAVVPYDTSDTKHLMRYHKEATSAFHRAYKELEKLREARLLAEIEAAEEAEEDASRNEANSVSEPQSNGHEATSCAEVPEPVLESPPEPDPAPEAESEAVEAPVSVAKTPPEPRPAIHPIRERMV